MGGAGAGLPRGFSLSDLNSLDEGGMSLVADLELPSNFGMGELGALETGSTGLGGAPRVTGYPGGSQGRASTPPGSPGTLLNSPRAQGSNDGEALIIPSPQPASTLPPSPP